MCCGPTHYGWEPWLRHVLWPSTLWLRALSEVLHTMVESHDWGMSGGPTHYGSEPWLRHVWQACILWLRALTEASDQSVEFRSLCWPKLYILCWCYWCALMKENWDYQLYVGWLHTGEVQEAEKGGCTAAILTSNYRRIYINHCWDTAPWDNAERPLYLLMGCINYPGILSVFCRTYSLLWVGSVGASHCLHLVVHMSRINITCHI